jgi:hypothetical protein
VPSAASDFSQSGSLWIGQAQSDGQVCTQNPIFCCQIFILVEQFLVEQTGHVGEQAFSFVLFHLDRP